MKQLTVFRMDTPEPTLLGTIKLDPIVFTYAPTYLANPAARAISCSLPLRPQPYSEHDLIPYFDGLLPEGSARRASAAQFGIEPDNYLMLLLHYGLETIGDIAITNDSEPKNVRTPKYRSLNNADLRTIFLSVEGITESSSEARLSLAGTQGKVGLAHTPNLPIEEGWLQPLDGAPSTHILKVGSLPDIPLLEYLCMKAAADCGINVPRVHLFDFGKPVLCVERYDRALNAHSKTLDILRLHQEDLSQAFGIPPENKYQELSPSTAMRVSQFLRLKSSQPIEDLEAFAQITCFNYLIGNCDNHLKNLSLLYRQNWKGIQLAPHMILFQQLISKGFRALWACA